MFPADEDNSKIAGLPRSTSTIIQRSSGAKIRGLKDDVIEALDLQTIRTDAGSDGSRCRYKCNG